MSLKLAIGNATLREADFGPVIDTTAKQKIDLHIAQHKQRFLKQIEATEYGTFATPTIIELDTIADMGQENFGPVLHSCRFKAKEFGRAIKHT